MKVGVLALQGDFAEHLSILEKLSVQTCPVRLPHQLDDLDGLIIPGGESTTIGKMAVDFDLVEPLREFGLRKPTWGTCAGAILLSKDARRAQPLLNLMDMTVQRNAFGRQVSSFEVDLDAPFLVHEGEEALPFHAVFIRAPIIETVSGTTRVLLSLPDGQIVAAQQGHLLATSFHPELTEDFRFHRYFLELINPDPPARLV